MSHSLNQIQLIGRLGKAPEMRYTPGGKAVTEVSMATDYEWKNADGTKNKETTWHNLEIWGKLAEIANEYLSKGRLIFIQGRQVHQKYEKDGQTKFFSKVIVNQLLILDNASQATANVEGEAEEEINFSVA